MARLTRIAGRAAASLACFLVVTQALQADGKVDPEAERYLKDSCRYLAGLRSFTFRVDETVDDVADDGQKLAYSDRRQVTISRPNQLMIDSTGDTTDRSFAYDGKNVTLLDKEHSVYGTAKAPDTIDAMLEDMHDRFGYTAPLADFLFSDPYRMLTEDVTSGTYLGLHHVRGVKCHHLAFRQKTIDWQIWIATGDRPLPRKFVITYKREASGPQYSATFTHWDVDAKPGDDTFELKPPEGARKVSFIEAHEAATSSRKSHSK